MAKATAPTLLRNPPASFEAALSELEAIVQKMETGAAPLEESLATYERGVALLKHCQSALAGAEQKLRIVEADTLRDFAPGEAGPEGR
jgi:exodeoxyribonuclease VII small subunit